MKPELGWICAAGARAAFEARLSQAADRAAHAPRDAREHAGHRPHQLPRCGGGRARTSGRVGAD